MSGFTITQAELLYAFSGSSTALAAFNWNASGIFTITC